MAVHLSEEEQIEALKSWWKQHGTKTVAAVVIIGASYFGWSQYQDHLEQKAQQGSLVFDQLVQAAGAVQVSADDAGLSEQEKAEIQSLANTLGEEYSDSLYADFAHFYLAKTAVESGDFALAREELNKVKTNSTNDAIKHLATLRLARVELGAGDYSSALNLLEDEPSKAFADAYAELRGDVYLIQKKYDEARTAYQSALDAITDPRSMRRSLVQMKLESAKVAEPASTSSGTETQTDAAAEGV